jgi:hypothetical protein
MEGGDASRRRTVLKRQCQLAEVGAPRATLYVAMIMEVAVEPHQSLLL